MVVSKRFYNWLARSPRIGRRRRRRSRQRALLSLLATATERGLPLIPVIEAFAHDLPRGREQNELLELGALLRQGMPLSEALRLLPGVLPDEVRLTAAASEEMGMLPEALRSAAEVLRQARNPWAASAGGTLLYLAIVFLTCLQVAAFLVIYIVPKLRKIFEDLNVKLPAATSRLMGLAQFADEYAILLLLIPPGVVLGLAIFQRAAYGVRWREAFSLGPRELIQPSPQIGILRSLARGIEGNIPIADHLRALATGFSESRGFTYTRLGEKLAQSERLARRGDGLADVLRSARLIAPGEADLLRTAEQNGHAGWMLRTLADQRERSFHFRWQAAIEIGRWVVLLLLGVMVAFIVISLFLPLIRLLNVQA